MKNAKHLSFVRQLPCIHCTAPAPSEAHHIKGIGHFSGAAMKASDFATMPLCRDCHRMIHAEPDQNFMQYEWLARTLLKAISYTNDYEN